MAAYKWKTGSRIKANADEAGAMCEQLENTVGLTPETLLEANRNEGTPLHDEFEWDDSKAAEEYRLTQSRYILRSLCIKSETEQKQQAPVRAFFKYSENTDYEHISVIIKNEDKRAMLLEKALKELEAFEKKYQTLTELQAVFNEISKLKGA